MAGGAEKSEGVEKKGGGMEADGWERMKARRGGKRRGERGNYGARKVHGRAEEKRRNEMETRKGETERRRG